MSDNIIQLNQVLIHNELKDLEYIELLSEDANPSEKFGDWTRE
ncbi:hypothetical protein [Anaerocolumna sp. MB42-C2]|nr:hypothetical protein [Anaerocolumna sp. MB42-C2]WMJ86821.1 hypothetical protein RBU59_22710 [Anaerocolumna sp. MB42-C2]